MEDDKLSKKELEAKIEELKAIEERIKVDVARNEELNARSVLGGKTDAGSQPSVPVELTAREYAKKVMSGEIKATD